MPRPQLQRGPRLRLCRAGLHERPTGSRDSRNARPGAPRTRPRRGPAVAGITRVGRERPAGHPSGLTQGSGGQRERARRARAPWSALRLVKPWF